MARKPGDLSSQYGVGTAGMTQSMMVGHGRDPWSGFQASGFPEPVCHCGSYKSEYHLGGIDDHTFAEMREETPEDHADEIVAQLVDSPALRAALLRKEPALRSLIEAIGALDPKRSKP